MTDITPPPELVQQWMNEIYDDPNGVDQFVSSDDRALAARAAQWGYQQAAPFRAAIELPPS